MTKRKKKPARPEWKPDSLTLTFAENLTHHRARVGYTLAQLGERAGITPSYALLLAQAKRSPSLDVIGRLAEALGVNVCTLLTVKP